MEGGWDVWISVFSIVSFFLFWWWFLEIGQQQCNRQATAWEKKQRALGCIRKLSSITCRWDSSTSQPGRKAFNKTAWEGRNCFWKMKCHGIWGGKEKVGWLNGEKINLCFWKGRYLVSDSGQAIMDNLPHQGRSNYMLTFQFLGAVSYLHIFTWPHDGCRVLFHPLSRGLTRWLALANGRFVDVMRAQAWNTLMRLGLPSCPPILSL